MDIRYLEGDDGRAVPTLARGDLTLPCDLAEMEAVAWAALADVLPDSVRAAVRGRSTGAPGVLLHECLVNRDKRAAFLEPSCERLAAILREWGLDVQAGAPSQPRCLDACCVEVDGMEPAFARETIRRAEAAVLPDGWLVVRGADAQLLAECLPPGYRVARLEPPYGRALSLCQREAAALQAFGSRLSDLLQRAAAA